MQYSGLFPFSQAQLTITQNDFASTGTIITMTDDTLPATLTLDQAGPNQTWDFSALNNHYTYQYHFINPASAPFASTFPTANLVIDVTGSGYFYYLNNTASALTAVGQSGDFLDNGNAIAIRLNPADKILEFPATYQSTFSNTMNFDETIYYNMVVSGYQIDSVRMKSTQQKNSVIDAWGTVTTPEGAFQCIRQKTSNAMTDLTDNTQAQLQNNDNTLQIFPSPAGDIISLFGITDAENSVVIIFNALGQEIMHREYNRDIGISVNTLKKGVYTLDVLKGNKRLGSNKFIKL